MTVATPDDVEKRWSSPKPFPDAETVQAHLDDAETICLAEFPDLLERIAADPSGQLEKNLVYVECQLALQVLTNPEQLRQTSQTSGPFTTSVTYGTETLSGRMGLSPQQRQLLGGDKARAYTIGISPEPRYRTELLPSQIINYPELGD